MVNIVVGYSAYLHGIGYDLPRFLDELRQAADHARKQAAQPQLVEAP